MVKGGLNQSTDSEGRKRRLSNRRVEEEWQVSVY
jgi:hypothetical protein